MREGMETFGCVGTFEHTFSDQQEETTAETEHRSIAALVLFSSQVRWKVTLSVSLPDATRDEPDETLRNSKVTRNSLKVATSDRKR
jgi:hypothetical protein